MVRISPRNARDGGGCRCCRCARWMGRLTLWASAGAIGFLMIVVVVSRQQHQQQSLINNSGFDLNKRLTSLRAPPQAYPTTAAALDHDEEQCRFYLAESAIPMSGLGVYTAVDLAAGEEAQSTPDICIYVADTPADTHFETHSWARDVWFGQFEGRNPRAACEGFATLFNSLPPGVQTSKLSTQPSPKNVHRLHDNAGLRRDRHPGAGAVSHYYGVTSTATRGVPAGSELTIDYGDWEYDANAEYEAPARSPEWLRRHGMCIDHIRIKPATDPGMGRGAFAAHSLRRGQRVAPAPLQIFRNASDFATAQQPEQPALFVNYCLRVPGTSLLLFPYGPGVNLVNHASSADSGKVNVQWQWSQHPMHHAAWLQLPLDQMLQMDYPGGLMLDLVATRDIAAGEELFLDYGAAWETAWTRHAQQWQPVPNADRYRYASDVDRSQPFPTVAERQQDPARWPSNLVTVCWTPNWDRPQPYRPLPWRRPDFDWPEGLVLCNLHNRTTSNDDNNNNNNDDSNYEYDVSLNFHEMQPGRPDKLKYVDTGVPHEAIFVVDKPYQSDLHLPNAFRHPLELPSELVPPAWVRANEQGNE